MLWGAGSAANERRGRTAAAARHYPSGRGAARREHRPNKRELLAPNSLCPRLQEWKESEEMVEDGTGWRIQCPCFVACSEAIGSGGKHRFALDI
eukprot:scaffold870_cov268-Pinguiococcus_pyrenoidosus.AAC.98